MNRVSIFLTMMVMVAASVATISPMPVYAQRLGHWDTWVEISCSTTDNVNPVVAGVDVILYRTYGKDKIRDVGNVTADCGPGVKAVNIHIYAKQEPNSWQSSFSMYNSYGTVIGQCEASGSIPAVQTSSSLEGCSAISSTDNIVIIIHESTKLTYTRDIDFQYQH